jgi:hypothetical protein
LSESLLREVSAKADGLTAVVVRAGTRHNPNKTLAGSETARMRLSAESTWLPRRGQGCMYMYILIGADRGMPPFHLSRRRKQPYTPSVQGHTIVPMLLSVSIVKIISLPAQTSSCRAMRPCFLFRPCTFGLVLIIDARVKERNKTPAGLDIVGSILKQPACKLGEAKGATTCSVR